MYKFMLAASGTMAALALLAGITAATPAQAATAATHCHWSTKEFNLPEKPDMTVQLDICIHREPKSGAYYEYDVYLSEAKWDALPFFGGKRFNHFTVNLRGERGSTRESNGYPYDLNFNESASGSRGYYYTEGGVQLLSTAATGWTADGYVSYDIASDGKGSALWQLHGTESV